MKFIPMKKSYQLTEKAAVSYHCHQNLLYAGYWFLFEHFTHAPQGDFFQLLTSKKSVFGQ